MAIPKDENRIPRLGRPEVFDIPPSIHSYVENGQSLLVTFFTQLGGTAYRITTRMLNEQQNTVLSERILRPAGTGVAEQFLIPVTNGYIVSITVSVLTGTIQYGDAFVTVQLMQGLLATSTPLIIFVENYITSSSPITYPVSPLLLPTQGRGHYLIVNPAPGAPGLAWTYQFPFNSLNRLVAATIEIQADANVANRYVEFQFTANAGMGTLLALQLGQSTVITANELVFFCLGSYPAYNEYTGTGGVRFILIPLPECIALGGAAITGILAARCVAMQAGDVFQNPAVQYESWVNA